MAVGQSVKGYRAGYIADSEAKSLMTAGDDGLPPLKLVKSDNGLDLALPSGKLVDYKFLGLRPFRYLHSAWLAWATARTRIGHKDSGSVRV
ncbi:hypothetical protein QFZ79_003082 [Arthrobacter sp. V4I6]|nr:hypothetical protein [Arthrobacter sp. V1I7]MDQ0854971.1 hypothetical protein [Arthrobacter sp. V4I6]